MKSLASCVALALLAFVGAGCGTDDDAQSFDSVAAPQLTTEPALTTTPALTTEPALTSEPAPTEPGVTTAPQTSAQEEGAALPTGVVNPEEFPFLLCAVEGDTVSAFNPSTLEQRVLMFQPKPGGEGLCAGETVLSESGRYLVNLSNDADAVLLLDLDRGEGRTVTVEELNAWATAVTGTGLDAKERRVSLGGFDKNDDGTLYFYEGDPWNDSISTREARFWTLDVALTMSSGTLAPTEVLGERYCYWSYKWNLDGTRCTLAGYLLGTSTEVSDSIFDVESYSFPGYGSGSGWVDIDTFVSHDGPRKVLYAKTFGVAGDTPVLYSIDGSRQLESWVNGHTGRILIASETLNDGGLYDASPTEIYEVSVGGGDPVLLYTFPDFIKPIG